MSVRHQDLTLRSRDGLTLHAQTWRPGDNPVAHVLVVHGYFEHGGRYQELAHHLAAASIATTAVDLRGHGKSAGQRGYVRAFADYNDDVVAALTTIDTGTPRFILGHSLGGLIVLDFITHHPLARELSGAVVVSPYLDLAMPVPFVKRWLAKTLAPILPTFAMPSGIDASGLSHDAQVVANYRNDPLVFSTATLGWFRETTRAQQRMAKTTHLDLPLLLYYSTSDPVAAGATTRAIALGFDTQDKTIHHRQGELHEILNEVERQQVHTEIREWILARHAKTPA